MYKYNPFSNTQEYAYAGIYTYWCCVLYAEYRNVVKVGSAYSILHQTFTSAGTTRDQGINRIVVLFSFFFYPADPRGIT